MTSAKHPDTQRVTDFLAQHKDIDYAESFVVDVNGVPRGKRIPRDNIMKLYKSGLRLPRSVHVLDAWGCDVLEAGLVVETGDTDGVCRPVENSFFEMPWAKHPTAQIMMSMYEPDGSAFFADPRHVLQSVLDKYAARGLTPVVATELEFYIYRHDREQPSYPMPPVSLRTGKVQNASQLYSLNQLEEFEPILSEIAKACALQNIPADTVISENGPGQMEINLNHVPNALLAADQATLMKRLIRGTCRKHGLDATFMAKPYADDSGNGMHVHFSILDRDGKNIFAGTDATGSKALHHAIGGLIKTMPDSMAVFAPNPNSYRRFKVGSHAPTGICWGYDNRSASLRIPESDIEATRIEHRVSGADANPYLVLAVILAGALHGIEEQIIPPDAISGNAYDSGCDTLPVKQEEALNLFAQSAFIADYLGEKYRPVYVAAKQQEKDKLESQISDIEYNAFLGEF